MTRRISEVAVCFSNASRVSVRSRAFSIAMAACAEGLFFAQRHIEKATVAAAVRHFTEFGPSTVAGALLDVLGSADLFAVHNSVQWTPLRRREWFDAQCPLSTLFPYT